MAIRGAVRLKTVRYFFRGHGPDCPGQLPFLRTAKGKRSCDPRCTYTDPEVAHVGVYGTDGLPGVEVATLTERFSHVDRALLDGEEEGFARVHYDRKNGKLLGGTIVARHAGEMISELTLAITSGLKVSALSATIHPYPTQAEVLKKIGDQYMRQRLTPTLKTLFKKWFAWRR